MLKKFFPFALIFFLNMVFASEIRVIPSQIIAGEDLEIEIDIPSYRPYLYFYDEDLNLVLNINLDCADSEEELCYSETYLILNSTLTAPFLRGNYSLAVYSHFDNRWINSSFEVISKKCSDGTYSTECSSNKPLFCDWEGNLLEKCSLCGCSEGYFCKGNESCIQSSIIINSSFIPFGDIVEIKINSSVPYIPSIFLFNSNNTYFNLLELPSCSDSCVGEETIYTSFESSKFTLGNYSLAIFHKEDNTPVFSNPFKLYSKCVYTQYSNWSSCFNGQQTREIELSFPDGCIEMNPTLIQSCVGIQGDSCDLDSHCSGGLTCQEGKCNPLLSGIGANAKNDNLYQDKEIFLISDKEWKTVLPFIPVSVWTVPKYCTPQICPIGKLCFPPVCVNNQNSGKIIKYPFLIYHQEDFYYNTRTSIDVDSIIYFIQQYSPTRITLIGETPKELENILIAQKDFGAGLKQEQIQKINSLSYLNYWGSFDKIVYVEDNYESALLASTYASLINSPLIIEGTELDLPIIFSGRKIICVGDVTPKGGVCSEFYNLNTLREKYKSETKTDKIILVNPADFDSSSFFVSQKSFCPTKSAYCFYNLYAKTSLMAPILASAKHELLLSYADSTPVYVKRFINPFLSTANYLTILASPVAITDKKELDNPPLILGDVGEYGFWIALDPHYYADKSSLLPFGKDGDELPDVSVGRIAGISSSDVSSYIARDLFLPQQTTNNVKIMASSFNGYLKSIFDNVAYYFKDAGFNVIASTSKEESYKFNPEEWKNQDLIYYADHGSPKWGGIFSYEIPLLNNSLVVTSACLTASTVTSDSFWAHAIRQGAIGFFGKVGVTGLNVNDVDVVNSIYYNKLDLGTAFKLSYYNMDISTPVILIFGDPQKSATFIGDPTLNLNPKRTLKKKISFVSAFLCQSEGEVCGIPGLLQCCPSQRCALFKCQTCFSEGKTLYWPYLFENDPSRCCNGWKWITKETCNFCTWCANGAKTCWPWNWRAGYDCSHCGFHQINDHKQCL